MKLPIAGAIALAVALLSSACSEGLPPLPTRDGEIGFPEAGPMQNGTLAIYAVEPDHGPFSGGNVVVLPGSGFDVGSWSGSCADCAVAFDGVSAPSVRFVDEHHLEVVVPPGVPGAVDVRVTQDGAEALLLDGYSYDALAVAPTTGTEAGGTWVTLASAADAFDASTEVRFAGAGCTGVVIESPRRLTCFTPAGEIGPVDVTALGRETITAPRAYRYEDPTLEGIGPGGGPLDGTLEVAVYEAGEPLAGAVVLAGTGPGALLRATTDARGFATIAGPSMRSGPIEVHVGAPCHSPASFLRFDARRVTVDLPRRFSCTTPSMGTVARGAYVSGALDVAGWAGVPAVEGEARVVRVLATSRGTSGVDPSAGGRDRVVEGDERGGYRIFASHGLVAVVAIAGTEGSSGVFTARRMGIARGVLLTPSEERLGVALRLDIPLDQSFRAEVTPPDDVGTDQLSATLRLEEGYVGRGDFVVGAAPTIAIPGQPALSGVLADGRFDAVLTHLHADGSVSTRLLYGLAALDARVGDFLPVPRCVGPVDAPYEDRLAWETGGGSASMTLVHLWGADLFWSITGPGDLDSAILPPLGELSVDRPAAGEVLSWSLTRSSTPSADYDTLGDRLATYGATTHQASCTAYARW